jgi:vesicle-fusing ATPase
MIEEMDLLNSFDSEIAINTLNTLESIMAVVEAVDLYKPNQPGYNQIQSLLARRSQEGSLRLEIGIKRLLSLIEMARQDLDDPGESAQNAFTTCLLIKSILSAAGKLVKSLESVMRSQQTSRYM